jgi:hypothetical protein
VARIDLGVTDRKRALQRAGRNYPIDPDRPIERARHVAQEIVGLPRRPTPLHARLNAFGLRFAVADPEPT